MKKTTSSQLGKLTVLVAALSQAGLALAIPSTSPGLNLNTAVAASSGACSVITNPGANGSSSCTLVTPAPGSVTLSSALANGFRNAGLLITGDTSVINTVNFSGGATGSATTTSGSSGILVSTTGTGRLGLNVVDTSTISGSSGAGSDGGSGISGAGFTLTNATNASILGGDGVLLFGGNGFNGGAGVSGSQFSAGNNGSVMGGAGGDVRGASGSQPASTTSAGDGNAGYAGGSGGAGFTGTGFSVTNTGFIAGGIGAPGAGGASGADAHSAGLNGGTGGRGGAGGAGGAGVSGTIFSVTNSGTISGGEGRSGGAGGSGGDAFSSNLTNSSQAGTGGMNGINGAGGNGISGTDFSVMNTSTGKITGGVGGSGDNTRSGRAGNATGAYGGYGPTGIAGDGGSGGAGVAGSLGSTGAQGGAGIFGSNVTVTNAGSITGGAAGDGSLGGFGGGTVGGYGGYGYGATLGGKGGLGGLGGTGGIGGTGGNGGAGVSGTNITLTNSGSIIGSAGGIGGTGGRGGSSYGGTGGGGGTGGTGGMGGTGGTGGLAGAGGIGGAGISGVNVTVTNSGAIIGGSGGTGGVGGTGGNSGGGRGGFVGGTYATGGAEGTGGAGGAGGNGGNGGAGIVGMGLTVTNTSTGTITGGQGNVGGMGGTGGLSFDSAGSAQPGKNGQASTVVGAGGAGGVGIVATGNSTITNSGTISGGLAADGTTRADAINFAGGGNKLVIQSGSTLTGNVVSTSGMTNGDTVALGGDVNASGGNSFNLSDVGSTAQFRGFQNFAKEGTSAWILTGTGAGNWNIAAGTLNLADGIALTGAITVVNGATLAAGTSSVTGAVSNGGTLNIAAGKTLSITGNFTNTGTFKAVLTDTAMSKIAATGAVSLGGNLFVDASTLTAANGYGGTAKGLISGSSVSGTFAAYDSNSALFKLMPVYTATSVDLKIISPTTTGVADAVRTAGGTFGPAIGAAVALDTIINANPGGTIAAALLPLTSQQQVAVAASQTVPLLTGASIQATQSVLDTIDRIVQSRIESNRGRSSGDDFLGNKSAWIKPFGSRARQGTRDNVDGYKANTTGLAVGIDGSSSPALQLGGAFVYAKSDLDSKSSVAPQSASINVYQLIGYGSLNLDSVTDVDFQVDLGHNQNSGRRAIGFASSTANSSYDSKTAHAGVAIGRTVAINSQTNLTPSVRADYTWFKDDAYAETGAGALNLNVDGRSARTLVIGADGKVTHQLTEQTVLIGNLGLGYDTINDRNALIATFAGAPGVTFATYGIKPSPWMARAGVGIVYLTQAGVEITGRYDAEHRSAFVNQTLSLKARWPF